MASTSETILVPGSANSSSSSATRTICLVCQKQFSQYTCPRCNTRYCSLNCYKKHNVRCTESFMRDNVMEEMRQMHQDDETKRRTLEMLKRVHLEEEMIDEEEDDESEGKDLRLEDLSREERRQFQRAIASGALSKMIEPWEPWWLKPSARSISLRGDGTQMVRPVNNFDQAAMETSLTEIPLGPETPLLSLSELTSRAPSPLLPLHFLEVLYSYCFTLRLYNGDWRGDPFDAAMVALTMSPVLAKERELMTVADVLRQCLAGTCSPEFKHAGGIRLGRILLEDAVCLLFLGRNALICMLCDLQRLVLVAEEILRSEKKAETRRKLKHAEKKLFFLMCWVNEQRGRESWSSLASLVQKEIASMAAAPEETQNHKNEQRWKRLIEEV